jgi:hypothetical protein
VFRDYYSSIFPFINQQQTSPFLAHSACTKTEQELSL